MQTESSSSPSHPFNNLHDSKNSLPALTTEWSANDSITRLGMSTNNRQIRSCRWLCLTSQTSTTWTLWTGLQFKRVSRLCNIHREAPSLLPPSLTLLTSTLVVMISPTWMTSRGHQMRTSSFKLIPITSNKLKKLQSNSIKAGRWQQTRVVHKTSHLNFRRRQFTGKMGMDRMGSSKEFLRPNLRAAGMQALTTDSEINNH